VSGGPSSGAMAPTQARPILEARGLTVVRGGKTLVHVDHFGLAAGEVHVLLGPNGAGKTTLMRALNGLEKADGELLFEGSPVRSGGDRLRLRRHTSAVFQQAYLLATTVRGNVESGLRIRGVHGDALRRRGDEALEMLGIAHLAERRRAGLSGGEAQRVSIARALAVDPAVVFLDEPMASLDPPTRRALLADLEAIFLRLSTAVLWVTHDTEEALAVARRVTFLAAGSVVQEGATTDVFNNPAAQVVADYLGLDVWLEGTVEVDEDGTRLVLPDGAHLVCAEAEPGPAIACIHPDDVMLFLAPPALAGTTLRNVLEATVREIRPDGRSRIVSLDWGGHRVDALLTRAACEELDVQPGQVMYAAIKASAIQLLPKGRPGTTNEQARST
jgi:tungstate transport system ATP-binding protein